MASLLFLAPADLGETVLATGAVAHLLQKGDALHVAADPDAMALFRAAPGLAGRIILGRGAADSLRAWPALARAPHDIVFDARGGLLGRALPGGRRIHVKRGARVRHLVEGWSEAADAEAPLAPALWLDESAHQAAAAHADDAPMLLLLAPGGATADKRWPAERFAAVARRLKGGPLAQAAIILLGGAARDRETNAAIARSLDADGVVARDVGDGLDLLGAAALLKRATLCIGNDNVLTHLAAAMGGATLTLFGPTDERVRAPWGPRARTLRARSLQDVAAMGHVGARAAMDAISIDAVEAAALDLLHAGGL